MDDEAQDMLPSSSDDDLENAPPLDPDQASAWLRESWHLHLLALDLILNPSLSLQAAMSAVNAFANRVLTFRPRKQPRITTTFVNRFFDAEYLARLSAEEARDRARRRKCRKLGCILGTTTLGLAILGFILLVVYCYLKPTSPRVEVVTVEFNYHIMTNVDAATIQAQQASGKGDYYAAVYNFSITYVVNFQNPNKKVDMFVHHVELKPFYYGFQLGRGVATSFKQARHSSSLLRITTVENHIEVPLKEDYSIKRDMMRQSIDFIIEIRLKARMSTVLGLRSPAFWNSINCYITIDPS